MTQVPPYPEPQCCMCAVKRSAARHMVAGPAIFICDRCVANGLRKSETQTAHSTKCDFCGLAGDKAKYIVVGEQANICDDCLRLCDEILREPANAT